MQGGDGIWPGDIVSLALPLRRHNEFVQATYDITDQVHVYASFSNGFQTARSLSQVPNDTFTIFRGNPFIPEGLSIRSEEHTSELQSLMRISYAVFCLKKKITRPTQVTRTRTAIFRDHRLTPDNTVQITMTPLTQN